MERNRCRFTIEATFEATLSDREESNSLFSVLGSRILLCIASVALIVPRTITFIINIEYGNYQDPRRHRIRVLIRRRRVPRRLRIQFDPDNAPRGG